MNDSWVVMITRLPSPKKNNSSLCTVFIVYNISLPIPDSPIRKHLSLSNRCAHAFIDLLNYFTWYL